MQRNYIDMLIFSNQHFPWAVYLDATTSILKHLHHSRDIGQVQSTDKILRVQNTIKKSIEVGVAG